MSNYYKRLAHDLLIKADLENKVDKRVRCIWCGARFHPIVEGQDYCHGACQRQHEGWLSIRRYA